jgi:hypothetical protein
MGFAAHLETALLQRDREVVAEQAAGDSLEAIIDRHLRAVEAAAETDLLTSVLLLDAFGRRLLHGAAPSLPKAFCEAIDGVEIGPEVGSCGTAAYLRRAVYVTDIANDPLWRDFRDLALPHGLRACWSTPIEGPDGRLLGTFAIYHLTPRGPTREELRAVRLITRHVAEAITTCTQSPGPGKAASDEEVASIPVIQTLMTSLARKRSGAGGLWRRMQQIERYRHRAEIAVRRGAEGSPAFRREMAEAAQEWSNLAREYESLFRSEGGEAED